MALADTIKGMGRGQAVILLITATVMITFFVVIALRVTAAPMSPLYTGLSLDDSSRIIAELEKTSTPYEIVANGSQIMIPSDKVLRMRMDMAQQGIPSGGSVVGYEIFDRSESFGSSNFVMNVNMMRALEGELARTIGSLSDVDSARVHLVMPQREVFTRDKGKPSASVTIRMRANHSLERSEVTAVTHLIASAVPGLDSSRVTVVDGHGKLLARGDGNSADAAVSNAQEFRLTYETHTQQQLEDLVEKVIGVGKVRVQVAADINFDRVVTNSEKFDPDGQVARSVQSTSATEKAQDKAAKGDVSVANNLPGGAAGADGGATSNHATDHSDETTNFEISKVVQNHVSEGGNVNRMSVAVLVDGTYAKTADGSEAYTPRTEEELKQLKTLVSSAIGYDEKRGDKVEVVNMRFTQEVFKVAEESFFDKFRLEIQGLIKTIVIGVIATLAILLLLRPAINTLIETIKSPSQRVNAEMAALQGGNGNAQGYVDSVQEIDKVIEVANVKGGMKASTMKKVNEIIEKYPDETMGVLRQWAVNQK